MYAKTSDLRISIKWREFKTECTGACKLFSRFLGIVTAEKYGMVVRFRPIFR